MSIAPLILDKPKSKGGQFLEGFAQAAVPSVQQSISDIIGDYKTRKQSASLADYLGLEGEEKENFVGMDPQIQKLYIQEAQKKSGSLDKAVSDFDKYIDSAAKQYGYKFLPKDKKEIRDKMKQAYLTGAASNAPEAFDLAFETFQTPRGEGAVAAEEIGDFGTRRKEWQQILEERRKNPELQIKGALSGLGSPLKAIQEEGASVLEKLGLKAPQLEGLLGPTEKEFVEQLSPEQKKSYERGKGIGEKAVEAAMVVDLGKFGLNLAAKGIKRFAPGLVKNLRKYATKQGISTQEAAANLMEAAENAGVNLNKVNTDPKEAQKLYQFSRELGNPTEYRTEKQLDKLAKPSEEVKTFEAKVKREKPLRRQVEAEEARKAESTLKKERQRGQPRKQQVMKEAKRKLGPAQANYRRAVSEYRLAEDAFVKDPSKKNESFLKAQEKRLEKAQENYINRVSESRTGSAKSTKEDLEMAAKEKIFNIQKAIREGKTPDLNRKEYNPAFIKEAKKFERMKEIPGEVKPTYFDDVHNSYAKAYKDRLDTIEKELKSLQKQGTLSAQQKARNLQKEEDILNKLLSHEQAALKMSRGRKQLQELGKARQAKEKIKAAQPIKDISSSEFKKIDNIASNVLKNPSKNNLSKAAKQSGFTENEIKEASQGTLEKIKGFFENQLKIKTPTQRRFFRDLKEFVSSFEDGKLAPFFQTNFGRNLLYNALAIGFEEATGKKLPYSSLGTILFTRNRPLTIAMQGLYRGLKLAKKSTQKKQLKKAIKTRNLEKQRSLQEKLGKKKSQEAFEELVAS